MRVSVIIPCYNGLHDVTIPCLQSVLGTTEHLDSEIVVVDNASQDGTPLYLKEIASRIPRMKVILNEQNRGFAGGINAGIRESAGDYLILLNNDTLVTEGWVDALLKPLEEDSHTGLVGPVTNSVGNEQLIYTGGGSTESVMRIGRKWTEMSKGHFFETGMLSFFCVALRRTLVEKVGLLDESFGLGLYEDDDYCVRARKAGYRLVCVEDVFIYHLGSRSLNKMAEATHQLRRKNKRLLEDKLGRPYRPPHPRERHMELLKSYVSAVREVGLSPQWYFKIDNRMRILDSLRPKSPFKRMRFKKELQAVRAVLRPYIVSQGDDFTPSGYYSHLRQEVLAMIPDGARRILDVGCGTGILGNHLKQNGPREVWGVEISAFAAAEAREVLDRVIVGDIEEADIPCDQGYFDCIVCADVLEHLRNPWSALKKLKPLLKQGGTLVASLPNVGFHRVIRGLLRGCWDYADAGILDRSHLRFFTLSGIDEMFSMSGYTIEEIHRKVDAGLNMKLLNLILCKRASEALVIQYVLRARV